MGTLGNFGTARAALEETFGWFDHEIRANPDLTDTVVADFMDKAGGTDLAGMDPMTQAALTVPFLRQFIHPDDFDTYWQVGLEQRQTLEDHMAVIWRILEEVAKRPTLPSSASSAGPPASGDGSTADLLQRVYGAPRPDLEVGIVEMQTAREAREGRQAG